jgi:two-component system chemotaxis response regulator CheY
MFTQYEAKELELIKTAIFDKHNSQPEVVKIEKRKIRFESKILLVDDSTTVRKILKKSFVDFGFEVDNILEAIDGEDAIYVLMEHEGVDLVVTDVNMPKIDGLGLIASIMKNQVFHDMNVLLLTSEAGDRFKNELSRYEIETFQKPFNKDSFFGYLIRQMVD